MGLTAEMARAAAQILKSKEAIRTCLRFCEEHETAHGIPANDIEADGAVPADRIRCCRCDSLDSSEENDILLCDGLTCNRAFHEQCLDPPVSGPLLTLFTPVVLCLLLLYSPLLIHSSPFRNYRIGHSMYEFAIGRMCCRLSSMEVRKLCYAKLLRRS